MPVLTEGWYIDGVSVEAWGAVLTNRDGWDDIPAMRGSNTVLLGRHGEAWRRKLYGPGKKTLTIGVNGTTEGWRVPATGSAQRALYESNLDSLLRLFAARHRTLTVTRVYADGSSRVAECEVTSAITPQPEGFTFGKLSLELTVPDTFWADTEEQTYTLPYDVSAGGTQSLEVFSLQGQTGYCSDAAVTVTGPCSTVTVADAQTGVGFGYVGGLSAGQTLAVDCGAWTAVKSPAADVLTDLALTGAVLLEISPAPAERRGPSIDVTATGSATGFAVTLATTRKWIR